MQAQGANIFTVDAQLDTMSNALRALLAKDLLPYGVSLESFLIASIARPDGDPMYEWFKDLFFRQYADVRDAEIRKQVTIIDQEATARATVIEAEALARKRAAEGYTYQQERGFDVAEKVASNQAVGEFANVGIGLGLMSGVGGPLGETVSSMVAGTMATSQPPAFNSAAFVAAVANPAVATNQENQTANFCFCCGREFNDRERFCPQCGTERGR